MTDILRINGLKLQQLIENLLSFSAWQSKNEVLTLSDFPLRGLVISVAKTQRLALKAAQIQLKLDVEDIVVTADRDLQFSARRLGAGVVAPESWEGLRTRASKRRRRRPARADSGEKPTPSSQDVRYWLDVFDPEGD